MKEIIFEGVIHSVSGKTGGAYIEFPYDTHECFGHSGRIKVTCFFEDIEYRGSLVKMNTECHIIGIKKEILKKLGKREGDRIKVRLHEDLEERAVVATPILEELLGQDESIRKVYEKFSYSRKKELNEALESAKKEETRDRRLKEIKKILEEK